MEKYKTMTDKDVVDIFMEAESLINALDYCIKNNDTSIPKKDEIRAACFYLWIAVKKELRQKNDLKLIEDLLEPGKGVEIISNLSRIKQIRDNAILSLQSQNAPNLSEKYSPENLDDIYF